MTGAYHAAKFGVEAVGDVFRQELRALGHLGLGDRAGSIDTPIWERGEREADEVGERAPAAQEELYGKAIERLPQGGQGTAARGIPPEKVAEAIEHALSARRPRTRYLVGLDARGPGPAEGCPRPRPRPRGRPRDGPVADARCPPRWRPLPTYSRVKVASAGPILRKPIDWSVSPQLQIPRRREEALRAAAVQLNSTNEKARNLEAAERLVRAAAADGAELVALPEKWNLLAGGEELLAGAEPLDGPSLTAARGWARELGIHLLAGSVSERGAREGLQHLGADRPRRARTSPSTARSTCSTSTSAGSPTASPTTRSRAPRSSPRRSASWSRGLTVCYDLRFPELYRILAVRGARLIAVPSAFTAATGRDHWEVLLRARAIENQVFVLAPNQVGEAPPHFSSYGHSAIVDPWGRVLALAPDGECFVAADLDLAEQERVRESRCPRSPTAAPRHTPGRS